MAAAIKMLEVDYGGGLGPQVLRNNNLLSHSTAGIGVPVSVGIRLKLEGVDTVSCDYILFDVLGNEMFCYNTTKNRLDVYNVSTKALIFTTTKDETAVVRVKRWLAVDMGSEPTVLSLQSCWFGSTSIYLAFTSASSPSNFAVVSPITGTPTLKFTLPTDLDYSLMSVDHTTGNFLVPNAHTGSIYVYQNNGVVVRSVDVSLLLHSSYTQTLNTYSPFAAFITNTSAFHLVYSDQPTTKFEPTKHSIIKGSRAYENDLRNLGAFGEDERVSCLDGPRCIARFLYEIPSIMNGGDTRDTHIMTLLDDDLLPIATASLLSTRCFETYNCQMRADRTTGRVFINDAGSIIAFQIPWW